MERIVSKSIKVLAFGFLFVLGATLANAQSSRPAGLVISKDVHRVANKKLYSEGSTKQLQLKSVATPWVQAKAIHRQNLQQPAPGVNLSSKGIPAWTISKPLHRKNKEITYEQPDTVARR